jgi:hypothetical protein
LSAAAESGITSVAAEADAEVGAGARMGVAMLFGRVFCCHSGCFVSGTFVVACCRFEVRVGSVASRLFWSAGESDLMERFGCKSECLVSQQAASVLVALLCGQCGVTSAKALGKPRL